ncbi:ComF family protein [Arthrobacter flavus]|uniref:ComF family protein n=1 Tax=Arthrobacter flavus TaxID=95172 RepID=A0ABW4QB83_9MICC
MNAFRFPPWWRGVAGHLDAVRMRPDVQTFTDAIVGFWSLLFPTECAVCGRLLISLCPECLSAIRQATVRPVRVERGAPALPPALGELESSTGLGDPLPVTAGGHYRSALARLVLAYKNHHRTDVGRPLQAALAGALHSAVEGLRQGGETAVILLVPVPAKGVSLRRRGYDPLGLLLDGLVRRGELPADCLPARLVGHRGVTGRLASALAGRGGPQHQKGLGSAQRRANVRFTMSLRRGRRVIPGAVCLVVDDVLTTGATIAEVTRVLRLAGAEVTGAVVVAATEPPSRAE